MKFGELEGRMRVYETSHDQPVLPGVYIVARMDRPGAAHEGRLQRVHRRGSGVTVKSVQAELSRALVLQGSCVILRFALKLGCAYDAARFGQLAS